MNDNDWATSLFAKLNDADLKYNLNNVDFVCDHRGRLIKSDVGDYTYTCKYSDGGILLEYKNSLGYYMKANWSYKYEKYYQNWVIPKNDPLCKIPSLILAKFKYKLWTTDTNTSN